MAESIGLVQADGKLPNMALMQISAYHESRGDHVEWWQGPLWNHTYDKVYVSKIFDFTELPVGLPHDAIIGGTGVDFHNRLPEEMADCAPSWTLYPNYRNHLGFTMKGCRFTCSFCCVPKKEGRPQEFSTVGDMLTNPNGGDRLVLLDNDFFGGRHWEAHLHEILDRKLKVCFCQGLNIRIITAGQASLLSRVNYHNQNFTNRYLTFAWDRAFDEAMVMRGVGICVDAGVPTTRMQFFVLIGYDTCHEENMHRVMALRNIGAMPFVMPYKKDDPYQRAFTRWVNHRATFKSCEWKDYKYRVDPDEHTGPLQRRRKPAADRSNPRPRPVIPRGIHTQAQS